jgi:type III secretion system YscQ/HrcQ family protein
VSVDNEDLPPPDTGPAADAGGPLGPLPRLTRGQVLLGRCLARFGVGGAIPGALAWLHDATGIVPRLDRPETLRGAAGLGRPGAIAELSWPRRATRVGLGIEAPVAHALVDRLLGFDRLPAEGRLQVTPVEWGVLTFLLARTLADLGDRPGPLGPWDLVIDRVDSAPFDPGGLGAIVTLRWPVEVGEVTGSVRLWVPEALVFASPTAEPLSADLDPEALPGRFGDLTAEWRAEAGTVAMPRGLGRLRGGGVLPIDGTPLRGTPQSPSGPVDLVCGGRGIRSWFRAEPVALSAGARLQLISSFRREPSTREALAVTIPETPVPETDAGVPPPDVPVTLTVELGRLNLSLRQVADLKPGDVLELGRRPSEPVELTSGGRLVARGELVQIDTELGVRVTNVFL